MFNNFRNNIFGGSDKIIITLPENRGVGVGIDSNNRACVCDADEMLDSTRDAECKIQFWSDGCAGLAYLMNTVDKALLDGGAGVPISTTVLNFFESEAEKFLRRLSKFC